MKIESTKPVCHRVMGVETEYGCSILGPHAADLEDGLDQFLSLACADLVSLPCRRGGGLFLGNGSRFYIDSGCHPEYCTPEVGDPAEVVRYLLAGDRLLRDLALKWERQAGQESRMVLFKCNVDYGGAFTTWACHESYSHRAQPRSLPTQLIPHLVSRIIYTGAGGLNPFCPGIQLCLSPRVYHLRNEISNNSTSQRGIYHLKNETLAGEGWNRLHVLCGDSVFSQKANYLKMGTTALILALVEYGLNPAKSVKMREPLKALKLFNEDLSLTCQVRLTDGKLYRAIDIQRRLLEEVESHLHQSFMPPWAPELCRVWRETLDSLEGGVAAVAPTLDWAMKAMLYQDFIRQQEFDPDTLNDWNQQVASRVEMKGACPEMPDPLIDDDLHTMLERLSSRRRSLGFQATTNSLSPSQKKYVGMRESLCELDVRFSWIGAEGVFASLEKAGQLNHRLPGVTDDSIEKAVSYPPDSGRACLRGNFVRKHDRTGGYACDWMTLQTPGPVLTDIHDPTATQLPSPSPARPQRRERDFQTSLAANRLVLLEQVGRHFNQGDYERAYHKLLSLPILRAQLNRQVRARFNQLLVRLQTRRGFAADALHLLSQENEASLGDPGTIVEFVNVLRFDGLAPWNDSFWTWIERGQNIQSNDSGPRMRLADLFAFRGHHGFGLGRKGQWEEATDLLQLALEDTAQEENLPRIYARTLADLADIWRMRGEPDRARFILMEVEELQVRHQCNGDMAEFTLANKAKLSTDTHRAMEWLAHARSIQTELNHRPGLARTLLLEARLDPKRSNQTERLEQIQALSATIPSLRHCPLVRKVLDQWNAWTSGSMIAGEKDYYWGL